MKGNRIEEAWIDGSVNHTGSQVSRWIASAPPGRQDARATGRPCPWPMTTAGSPFYSEIERGVRRRAGLDGRSGGYSESVGQGRCGLLRRDCRRARTASRLRRRISGAIATSAAMRSGGSTEMARWRFESTASGGRRLGQGRSDDPRDTRTRLASCVHVRHAGWPPGLPEPPGQRQRLLLHGPQQSRGRSRFRTGSRSSEKATSSPPIIPATASTGSNSRTMRTSCPIRSPNPQTIDMPATVYIGFALSSHNRGLATTARSPM